MVLDGVTHHADRAPWLWRVVAALTRPWLKIRTEPPEPGLLLKARQTPVVYLLERYGISNAVILEEACREHLLPPPLMPMPGGLMHKSRALLALSRRDGLWFRRPRNRTHSSGLSQIVAALRADPNLDVHVVPVSIFVGRAPASESGWFRVLFAENWNMVGRFRRLLGVLLNGRDTIVHFSAPVSLRDVLNDGMDTERTVRKASRVMRAHFRRIRTAVIGPDLSHRRTVIDTAINAEGVRQAIQASAGKERIKLEQAEARARSFAWEIAADYSHTVVRSASFLLQPFWNKLYGGIRTFNFDTLKQAAPGHEVVYVPCHRSHIDYLLVSYLLYVNGIVPPHIAAGVNLNLPVVGSLLRKGGAFFLRRSFRANALYSAVFSEYVAQLFKRGVSLEYFIEGGRSRTGRLLEPRAGMLAMTVRSYLRESQRPVVFQPVYIGYERLLEGKAYIGELSGKAKEKESLWGLFRSLKLLREKYGKVSVSFGEPIYLAQHLDNAVPNWREEAKQDKQPWFNDTVVDLAHRIMVNINRAADVNPINLLALALLATPKHAMAEDDLIRQIELFRRLLAELPYSDRVSITEMSAAEIIQYGEQMKVIERVKHPLGDVLEAPGDMGVMLSYFRNNVLHLFASSAWVACCFLNNRRLQRASVERLGRFIYPFIQNELFLSWTEEEFGEHLQQRIEGFIRLGLLEADGEDGRILRRKIGQTDEAYQLRVIATSLQQAFERYYIAIALLVKKGAKRLSTSELENLCHLTAQRLSLLHTQAAPEFFDKSLFRGFISTLREKKVVWLDDQAKLDFGQDLDTMANDAKLILSRELRHSILKLAGESRSVDIAPTPKSA
ncbi:MAG: glycerol-3-phosphate 1-O-acyltransferase PlsB [Ahniella sp.]|nr:glycerol-3-phosphate 1-O-acyltransferase PlsB [Ahniella sp.]